MLCLPFTLRDLGVDMWVESLQIQLARSIFSSIRSTISENRKWAGMICILRCRVQCQSLHHVSICGTRCMAFRSFKVAVMQGTKLSTKKSFVYTFLCHFTPFVPAQNPKLIQIVMNHISNMLWPQTPSGHSCKLPTKTTLDEFMYLWGVGVRPCFTAARLDRWPSKRT